MAMNPPNISSAHAGLSILRTGVLAFLWVVLGSACAKGEPPAVAPTPQLLRAQTDQQVAATQLLSDAEVKKRYQSCPGGWYAGPRPGKARFTKDPWLWTVTSEFAKRFCIPEEFVSTELKGAEAVAFKLRQETDEVNCGFGGNPDACGGELLLRFEVYIKSDVPLPKHPGFDANSFQAIRLPSSMLITRTNEEWFAAGKLVDKKNKGKVFTPFPGNQVGLHGMKGGVVAWPIAAMYLQTYYGSVFQGIDYYAFDASVGFLGNPGVKQSGVEWFAINFRQPDLPKMRNKRTTEGLELSDFDHTIALPKAFMDKVVEVDTNRRGDLERLMDKAFKRPAGQ
jgi:hypothetical protein